jgi:cell division protein FtsW (lipid II flippase)
MARDSCSLPRLAERIKPKTLLVVLLLLVVGFFFFSCYLLRMSGAAKWIGLTFTKIMYQFMLGKYLIVYLLKTYDSKMVNNIAYSIFTLSITACLVMFLAGVPPENRAAAATTACALFIVDLFILETVTAYLMTFICANKNSDDGDGADETRKKDPGSTIGKAKGKARAVV